MSLLETLSEALKKPFLKQKQNKDSLSISRDNPNIEKELTSQEDNSRIVSGYLDDGMSPLTYSLRQLRDNENNINKQNEVILEYRRISAVPEVANAIDEIINEMSFVVNNKDAVYINIRSEANLLDSTVNSITQNFNEILELMDFNYNVDHLCRRFYIDGQLNVSLAYNEKNIKKGIQRISIMSPLSFIKDINSKTWKYVDNTANRYVQDYRAQDNNVFSTEEIVHIDSGLYSEGTILSHLHNSIKVTNQLQTLEDLLIPLRFSRSVSRRVFNINVGNLPYSKAIQAVQDIQDKFKYKKYYNVEKGTISNSSVTSSIVEDYYIPNRDGQGTTIDTLDETGNLGEMGDIEYFQKKLYISLKVPTGRISGADKGNLYDYSATQIENDEIRFFAFINRLRQRFNTLFIELLRRHMVAKGLFSNNEFEQYKKYIYVSWEKENNFLEKQALDIFKQRLDLYTQSKEYIGDIISKKYVLKNILNFSDEEIEQMKKEILEEKGVGEEIPAPDEVENTIPDEENPDEEQNPDDSDSDGDGDETQTDKEEEEVFGKDAKNDVTNKE